ncbi:MAG: branched-chain amino acid transport system substrate-binding protein, partial [Candidatus Kentron sp. G]
KKLLDTFGAQVSSDHERYPADVKCLGFLYLYVGRYPRNNASRNTQAMHGIGNITPAMMRDGLENLEMTQEKYIAAGLPGFSVPFKVSCENHAAPGLGAIQQWDAKKKQWKLVSAFIASDREVVDPLIAEDSMAYAAEAGISADNCKK